MAFGASMKDKAILAIGGMTLLYAASGFLWFKALTDKGSDWNKSQRAYTESVNKYQRERALIDKRVDWEDAYEEEREKMPMFPEGEKVGEHWLERMDEIANQNHMAISTRAAGKEEEVGDVYELPVEVKSWEGALDPLVNFLYALEHAEEAMFDIKAIDIRTSSHKGYLKGQFTLTCAYMRGDTEESGGEEQEKK